jgi:hypothetical protein
LAVALLALSLAAPALRTLGRHGTITLFQFFQAAAGIGAAFFAVQPAQHPMAAALIGAASIALAAATFAFAMPAKRALEDHGFYLAVSLALLLVGGALATSGMVRGLLWAAVAATASVIARRTGRDLLMLYATALSWSAAASAGILAWATDAFTAACVAAWSALRADGIIVVALSVASALSTRPGAAVSVEARWRRVPSAAGLLLCALCMTAAVVVVARVALPSLHEDAAVLATARTLALAGVATALAMLRRAHRPERLWVAYVLLALCAVKLVTEDLQRGRALTLLVSFVAYGLSMIAVQRLARERAGGDSATRIAQPPTANETGVDANISVGEPDR